MCKFPALALLLCNSWSPCAGSHAAPFPSSCSYSCLLNRQYLSYGTSLWPKFPAKARTALGMDPPHSGDLRDAAGRKEEGEKQRLEASGAAWCCLPAPSQLFEALNNLNNDSGVQNKRWQGELVETNKIFLFFFPLST